MKHIAVLKGGWSAEREVSLVSGVACAKALAELGYRVSEIDVQPDIASRVRHGRYRKAVPGGHPAIVENPGPRFRIVVINREPRIPVRHILKADGLRVFKLLALSGRRERQQSRNQAPYAAVHGISPQVANAPVGACSTTGLQHLDIRYGMQSSRRRQDSAAGRSKARRYYDC